MNKCVIEHAEVVIGIRLVLNPKSNCILNYPCIINSLKPKEYFSAEL